MKVENPEMWRKNVSNMFKTKFNMDNDSLCRNIEISIFNHTLREAGNKKIVKKWENKYFVQLYVNRLKSLLYNMENNNTLLNSIKNREITKQSLENLTHSFSTFLDFLPSLLYFNQNNIYLNSIYYN